HRVGRRAGQAQMAADAAHHDEPPARSLEIVERSVHGSQHPEHVGLELPAVILERQPLERAHHPAAGIRHHHHAFSELRSATHPSSAIYPIHPPPPPPPPSTSPSRVTSHGTATTPRPFCASSAASACSRSTRRAPRARSAPRRANSRASPAPMPAEAPVMKT